MTSSKAFCSIRWVSAAVFLKIETKFYADSLLRIISRKESLDHKNTLNLITCPLSLTAVGTLIHKAHC
jgi:hypothetical protein